MWQEKLVDAGVMVETVDADHVRLRTGTGTRVVRLKVLHRPLNPAKVEPLPPGEQGLLVLPRASKQVEQAALERGWELVTADRVVLRDKLPEAPAQDEIQRAGGATPPARRRGPQPRGALTAIRRLLAAGPATQSQLAELSGLSQPYLSKVLAELSREHLVDRTTKGWAPTDRRRLIDWWLRRYPGPGGATSYWASLAPLADQARTATAGVPEPVAVSGDLAADLLTPWRRPRLVVVYAEQPPTLTNRGFVSAASIEDATLALTAPADPGVWLPRPWPVGDARLLVAEPLTVLYDIGRAGGPDAVEAAEHLTAALLDRLADSWREAVIG
jgi:hypothetical protein